jgi:hypothetical protein
MKKSAWESFMIDISGSESAAKELQVEFCRSMGGSALKPCNLLGALGKPESEI